MYALAAREPFTNRAFFARPFARRLRGTAVFAVLRLRRRVEAERKPPLRPARWNSACVAGVCCAKPAKPPGGTTNFTVEPRSVGIAMDMEPPPPPEYPNGIEPGETGDGAEGVFGVYVGATVICAAPVGQLPVRPGDVARLYRCHSPTGGIRRPLHAV